MKEFVRQTLVKLVGTYGTSLAADARRCRALLRDLCGEARKEVNTLVAAVEEHVSAELVSSTNEVAPHVLIGRPTQKLADNTGINQDLARWAVETWAIALGVIAPELVSPAEEAAPQKVAPNTLPDMELPAQVIAIANRAAPNSEWTCARWLTKEQVYEFHGCDSRASFEYGDITVAVTPTGRLTQIRQSIPVGEVPLNILPLNLREEARLKGMTFTRCETQGQVHYLLTTPGEDSSYLSLDINAEGQMTNAFARFEQSLKDVPKAVRATLKSKIPSFVVSKVFEISDRGHCYEFHGLRPEDEEEITLRVSDDCTTIEIDEPDGKWDSAPTLEWRFNRRQ
jgi:hypothetical protein